MKLHYPQDIPHYVWEFFGRILRSLDDISEDVMSKYCPFMNLLPAKTFMLFNKLNILQCVPCFEWDGGKNALIQAQHLSYRCNYWQRR